MSDLLASLIVSSSPPSTQPPSRMPEAAVHAAGLVVHDVEAYLNDPKNKALMASTGKKSATGSTHVKHSAVGESFEPQPVQLGGAKTSHHVSALNHLCQQRGLVPLFEIVAQEEGGFGGWLRVGNETVVSYEKWFSKKEAKEALAEKGVEILKSMGDKGKGPASEEDNKNWVGLLMRTSDNFQ